MKETAGGTGPGHQRSMRRPIVIALGLLALSTLFATRLLHTAEQKSFTVDEPHYVGTGLYLWKSGDYHFSRSLRYHPPLTFHLAAIPLLALDLDHLEPVAHLGVLLVKGPDPSPDLVRLLSRLPFILLACWGAVLVFGWSYEVAGVQAGLLAVFLYTFSPTILANASLAHSDITVTVLYLQTLYAFWRWGRRPTRTRFALCGVSLGLALLAKMSALLLLPSIAFLLLGIALGWPRLADGAHPSVSAAVPARLGWAASRFAGLLALAIGAIWLGYGGSFAVTEGSGGPFEGWSWVDLRLPGYLHSLGFDLAANASRRSIFFFGEIYETGRWYFLPVGFLLKTPLAFLALLVLASFTRPPGAKGPGPFLGIPVLVYALFACFVLRMPQGVRYLLPLFPLAHLFVATRLATASAGWRRTAVALGCAWLACSSLSIHPHYLAYFNEVIGGPENGHHYLSESDLDWGQDLGTLARFLQERGNPRIWLAYDGPEAPEHYGIRARRLRSCRPVTGWVAIRASLLQGLRSLRNPFRPAPEGCFDWLREREPVAQPGYSILVYEIPRPQPG